MLEKKFFPLLEGKKIMRQYTIIFFLATKAYISILKKQNSSTHTKWKESMYYMIVNLHWEGDIGRQFVFHRLDSGTLNSILLLSYGEARGFFSMFLIKLVGVTVIRGSVGGGGYYICWAEI